VGSSLARSPFSDVKACRRVALAILLVGMSACLPLPIPHNQLVSIPVQGVVRRQDGTPASRVRIGVTADERDEGCTRHGARGVTDSAGRFRLPAVRERQRVLWLTMFENFGMATYWFCADGSSTGSSSKASRISSRTHVTGWVRGDTLSCITWELDGVPRVTCNGSINQRPIVTDGRWSHGRDSGTYRLLLTDAQRYGYSWRAVVQWVTSAASDAIATGDVRGQIELPTGEPVLGGALLMRDGRWFARVESVRRTKWNKRRWLTFELGAPGEARPVPP
jgi:hypothetical protein